MKRILRVREVVHVTGVSRTSIYRKVAEKTFPPPLRLAPQTVGWREEDIEAWMRSLQPDTQAA